MALNLGFIKSVYSSSNTRIVSLLTALSMLVLSWGTLISSYLQQTYSETISWPVRDGWCKPKLEGFGVHCFGDLYAPITIAGSSNPWSADLKLAYTPLNLTYYRILGSSLLESWSTHASMIINITLTVLALSVPGIYVWRNQQKFEWVSGRWFLLLSLTAAPTLVMIDRGNSSFLLFPMLFFFYRGIQTSSLNMTSLSLIVMCLWKPQSIILLLGIYIFFGVKPFLMTLFKVIILFSASFLLYPSDILQNVSAWLQNSRDYQNYLSNPTPGNYSLINFFGFVKGSLTLLLQDGSTIDDAFQPAITPNGVSIFSMLSALAILILLFFSKRQITYPQFVLYTCVFLVTLPGTTFSYYFILMLIPILVVSADAVRKELRVMSGKLLWITYLILLVLIVPAWPLNWNNTPFEIPIGFATIGINWIGAHIVISLAAVFSFMQLVQHVLINRQRDKNQ
jgi:hypothetical protein